MTNVAWGAGDPDGVGVSQHDTGIFLGNFRALRAQADFETDLDKSW